jgi:hypothetical protein
MKMLTFAVLGGLSLATAACDAGDREAVTAAGRGFELNEVSDQSIGPTDANSVLVTIDRKGGFEGQVTIEVAGLPAGVSVDGGLRHTIMETDESITLTLRASDGAPEVGASAVTVRASANVDGQQLSKEDLFSVTVKPRS